MYMYIMYCMYVIHVYNIYILHIKNYGSARNSKMLITDLDNRYKVIFCTILSISLNV